MNIQKIVEQAAWRLRAYLGAPQTNPDAVGWRRDARICLVACWLHYEEWNDSGKPADLARVIIDPNWIHYRGTSLPTSPVLAHLMMLVDSTHPSFGLSISRSEAQEYLLVAERQAAQYLLPAQAASLPRCDYRAPARLSCQNAAVTPFLCGFIDCNLVPAERPQRASCQLFAGQLCAEHLQALVVAPESWWPSDNTTVGISGKAREIAEVLS